MLSPTQFGPGERSKALTRTQFLLILAEAPSLSSIEVAQAPSTTRTWASRSWLFPSPGKEA